MTIDADRLNDPKAREIMELGKQVGLNMERDESLRTGDLRRALEHFAAAVAWAERKDAERG